MQPPELFHSSINRILVASDDRPLCTNMLELLQTMAPTADIRCAHGRHDIFQSIFQWQPALLVIELTVDHENVLTAVDQDVKLPLAPFTLGIADHASGADVAQAMRYGFCDVIDKPFEGEFFQRKIHSMVSRLPLLPVQIGQVIYPYLYSGTPIQMKSLLEEIDRCIFEIALQITSSKNGVGKMLGISRQLVQYHLKKIAV